MFQKTVKPIFSNKGSKSAKIILIKNDEIVSDDKKTAEIMNEYCLNVTKDVNIPEITPKRLPNSIDVTYLDPINRPNHTEVQQAPKYP